jgi:putative transposase
VKGRKRHVLVDTLGLVWAVVVHPADVQDRVGARQVFQRVTKRQLPRVRRVWADGGYTGTLVTWVRKTLGWLIDIVQRRDDATGFELLPHRWIVERNFAWFGHYRRLSLDYEFNLTTSEMMVYLAMSHLMLKRLARA